MISEMSKTMINFININEDIKGQLPNIKLMLKKMGYDSKKIDDQAEELKEIIDEKNKSKVKKGILKIKIPKESIFNNEDIDQIINMDKDNSGVRKIKLRKGLVLNKYKKAKLAKEVKKLDKAILSDVEIILHRKAAEIEPLLDFIFTSSISTKKGELAKFIRITLLLNRQSYFVNYCESCQKSGCCSII